MSKLLVLWAKCACGARLAEERCGWGTGALAGSFQKGAQCLLLLDLEPGVASEAPRTESAILDVLEPGSTANREPGQ